MQIRDINRFLTGVAAAVKGKCRCTELETDYQKREYAVPKEDIFHRTGWAPGLFKGSTIHRLS